VRLLVLRAVVLLMLGRASAAVEAGRSAVEEAERIGDKPSLAYAYDIYDSALIHLGRYEEAVHRLKALAILEEIGELDQLGRALNNLGVAAHVEGNWPEALGFYARAVDSWKRAGNFFHAAVPADNTGLILLNQGRLDEAEPLFRDALRVARASGSRHGEAPILMNLGMLASRRGTFDDAARLLEDARQAFADVGRTPWVYMTEARIAELKLAQGDAEGALALAASTFQRASAGEEIYALKATLHRVRGTALLRLGRLAEAEAALGAGLAEARLKRDRFEIALSLAALERLLELTGRPANEQRDELQALIERLGIVTLPGLLSEPAPLSVPG
jgi:tetratricopeptide (TPR) repeat protein